MRTISTGLKLLQYDYIGGHGSRGYGKIKLDDVELNCVIGEVDDNIIDECLELLRG